MTRARLAVADALWWVERIAGTCGAERLASLARRGCAWVRWGRG